MEWRADQCRLSALSGAGESLFAVLLRVSVRFFQRGWPWGGHEEEFDWLYLQSYTSTALIDGRSKEDGSLHETECIAPRTREGKPVYLLFHLWHVAEANDASSKWLEDAVHGAGFWRGASLGGERGYGWGRIAEAHVTRLSGSSGDLFEGSGWRWECTAGEFPVLQPIAPPGSVHGLAGPIRALGHAIGEPLDGRMEPLTGRLTVDGRSGQSLSEAVGCYVPGSVLRNPGRFSVDTTGCWREQPAATAEGH